MIVLLVAVFLDSLLGDPRWLPHLIVGYGRLISWGEKRLNRGSRRFLKGAWLTLLLVSLSFWVPYLGLAVLRPYPVLWIGLSSVLLFYCIANRTLIKEGIAVFSVLQNEGLAAGRKRLSWIVGRETTQLTAQQVRIATLETMSENLSDGVIAPLFYFACFGPAGAAAYKMVNTLDSMLGYKNERYEQFGKFAARLDDVANYIPSRFTAILMLIVTFRWGGLGFVFREGKKHSSPNAGYPEAALAYILGCQFGGPNVYHGTLVEKPYIGTTDRPIQHRDVLQASRINITTMLLTTTLIMGSYWLLSR